LSGRGEALFPSNLTDVLRAGALCALRRLLSSVFAAGFVFLLACPVGAETDAFMRAVGFALTGSDKADPKVIDRASCVFAIKNELFRLNNVYTDRIKIQGRQRQSFGALEQWVTVTLQGDEIVFEKTVEPPLDMARNSRGRCGYRVPACLSRTIIPTHDTNCIWQPTIRTE
jgi:hypothetical protein